MKPILILSAIAMTMLFNACNTGPKKEAAPAGEFKFLVEQFADLKIMRYQVPGF